MSQALSVTRSGQHGIGSGLFSKAVFMALSPLVELGHASGRRPWPAPREDRPRQEPRAINPTDPHELGLLATAVARFLLRGAAGADAFSLGRPLSLTARTLAMAG